MSEQVQPITDPRPKHRFSRSNARFYALKAVEARRTYAAQRLTDPAPVSTLSPQPTQAPDKPRPAPHPDDFVGKTLLRVRKQMTRLDRMMFEETDPAKLDRLAAAFSRLSEIEQKLADRPLPGSKRPAPEKPSQGKASSLLLGGAGTVSDGQVEQE